MTQLLIYREKAIRFFKEYETWFLILAKIIGMMFVFTYINENLGYYELLGSAPVNLLLSLVCSIIPSSFTVFIVAAVIAAHMLKFSMLVGLLVIAVMVIIYLLFLKFAPRQSLVLLAAPVLLHYNLGFALPVIAGLLFNPYAAIPAAAGVFMVSFIRSALQYGGELASPAAAGMSSLADSLDPEKITEVVSNIFTQAFADKTFVYMFLLVVITAAVMFVINRFSFNYVWYISIAAGAVADFAAAVLTGPRVGSYTMTGMPIGILVGAAAALVIQFFRCVVDYKSRESLQFEDEEYYYYVQAIPKYLTGEYADEPPVEEKFPKKDDIIRIAKGVKKGIPSGKKDGQTEE